MSLKQFNLTISEHSHTIHKGRFQLTIVVSLHTSFYKNKVINNSVYTQHSFKSLIILSGKNLATSISRINNNVNNKTL